MHLPSLPTSNTTANNCRDCFYLQGQIPTGTKSPRSCPCPVVFQHNPAEISATFLSLAGGRGEHSHCRCREHGPHSKEAQQHQASLFPSRRSVSTKYAYRGNEKTRGHGTEMVAGDTSSDPEVQEEEMALWVLFFLCSSPLRLQQTPLPTSHLMQSQQICQKCVPPLAQHTT